MKNSTVCIISQYVDTTNGAANIHLLLNQLSDRELINHFYTFINQSAVKYWHQRYINDHPSPWVLHKLTDEDVPNETRAIHRSQFQDHFQDIVIRYAAYEKPAEVIPYYSLQKLVLLLLFTLPAYMGLLTAGVVQLHSSITCVYGIICLTLTTLLAWLNYEDRNFNPAV